MSERVTESQPVEGEMADGEGFAAQVKAELEMFGELSPVQEIMATALASLCERVETLEKRDRVTEAARRLVSAWDAEPHAHSDAEIQYSEELLREAISNPTP